MEKGGREDESDGEGEGGRVEVMEKGGREYILGICVYTIMYML